MYVMNSVIKKIGRKYGSGEERVFASFSRFPSATNPMVAECDSQPFMRSDRITVVM